MQNLKIILIIWFFSFTLVSCIIYPHAMDIPLIQEKNDLRVDASVSSVIDVSSTVSYGLTKNIAVQGFGSYGSDDKRYFQGAIGYFKNTGNSNILEWYTGFGTGYGDAYDDANPGNLFGNYQMGFIQINYGKVNSRFAHMDYGISFKTGYLRTNLTDRNYFGIYSNEENFSEYPYPVLNDNSILFQPVAFVRLGGERLKFNIKGGCMWIYQLTNKDQKLPVGNFNIGIGLNYYVNLNKNKTSNSDTK